MELQPWLPGLLQENSFRQCHAFFGGPEIGFHNHKAHAIVALARLGASEERVRQHCAVEDTK